MKWLRTVKSRIQRNVDASIFIYYRGFSLIKRDNPIIEILPYCKGRKLNRLKVYKEAVLEFFYFNLHMRFRLVKNQLLDGPSIPQILQWLVSFLRLLSAGLFHDGAFGPHGVLEVKYKGKWVPLEYNMNDGNQIMRFAGHVEFAGDRNILLSNLAVNLFGKKFFKPKKFIKPTHRVIHKSKNVLKVVPIK